MGQPYFTSASASGHASWSYGGATAARAPRLGKTVVRSAVVKKPWVADGNTHVQAGGIGQDDQKEATSPPCVWTRISFLGPPCARPGDEAVEQAITGSIQDDPRGRAQGLWEIGGATGTARRNHQTFHIQTPWQTNRPEVSRCLSSFGGGQLPRAKRPFPVEIAADLRISRSQKRDAASPSL